MEIVHLNGGQPLFERFYRQLGHFGENGIKGRSVHGVGKFKFHAKIDKRLAVRVRRELPPSVQVVENGRIQTLGLGSIKSAARWDTSIDW